MNGWAEGLSLNAGWEVTRLRRSRRLWLLLLPLIAGPVGSAVADLYLHVPSTATARVLGLLIAAGLGALVTIDLTALGAGEELALRAHLTGLVLPQPRTSLLAGRLLVDVGGSLASYTAGAALVWTVAGELVAPGSSAAPILDPGELLLGLLAMLVLLAGVTSSAAVVTHSAAQALVAGVLAGVVVAGVGSYLLLEGTLTRWFPVALAIVGIAGLAWSLLRYDALEA